MALKNLKNYEPSTARNAGITQTDQVQLVARSAVPSDSTLANGRMVYVTGTGFRFYNEGAWFTVPTSTSGGSAGSWDTLYSADKTLTLDGTTLTFNLTHASNDGFTLAADAAAAGSVLQFSNSGSGNDVDGTSNTWGVSNAGAATFQASVTSPAIVSYGAGANANLTIDAKGTGTISLGATSTGAITLTRAVTATASITVTGTADSTVLTVTAGDAALSNGTLSITNDDTDTALTIVADSVTTGKVIDVNADGVTSGTLLHLDSTAAGFTGYYIDCYDGAASDFTVGLYGAVVVAGNAATDVLTITAGHEVITSGNLTLTSGNLVMTSGSFTYTAGDMTMSDGSITVTDADNAATLSVTNNTATSASVFVFAGSGAFTGNTTNAFMTLTPSGLTTGTALYLPLAAATTGKGLHIVAGALTSGNAVYIDQDGEALTSGELLTVVNTESGALAAKTGNLASVTSSVTETTASRTENYNMVTLTRNDTANCATFTLTSQGSVLKVAHAATQTAGTLTDTVIGIQVAMDVDGAGDALDITHLATGAITADLNGAATSVDDVDIDGTGVHADNTATLSVANSGATAAGGSVLRVAHSGTPAAATSYLVDLDYSGATMTNNPVAVYVNGGSSTAAVMQLFSSGAAAGGTLELTSTSAGALGPVLKFDHDSASPAASDVIARLDFYGEDSAGSDVQYAKADVVVTDATDGSEDADVLLYVSAAGSLVQMLQLDSDVNGVLVGSGAASAYVSSKGAYDLVLETNSGSNSGTITITDAANGNITLQPNGTGNTVLYAPSWVVTSKAATSTLTEAEGGVIVVNTGAGGITLTLPAAANNAGLWYTFKKTNADASALTVDGNAAETIDGAVTHTAVDAQYDTLTIACDGSNWHIVYQKIA